MAVRLKDIAEDLGVSVVTVSKVLRNHSDIGPETRARVLKRARELNYRPNQTARALVTGRSGTIGLIVPDLIHSFFAQVARGVTAVLKDHGCSLLISSSEEDGELEQQEIAQMFARGVDAVLLATVRDTAPTGRAARLPEKPLILIDRRCQALSPHFVGLDDKAAGRLATEHLIAQGCRRIAHIRGRGLSPALDRLAGFREAMAAQGLSVDESNIVAGRSVDNSADASGYEAMKTLLARGRKPDGVFCFNDPMALGAMKAILEAGLRIPDDIALIGCGNLLHSEFLRVPLSSIDQDSSTIGASAARLALALLSDTPPEAPAPVLVAPKLWVRDSTRRRA